MSKHIEWTTTNGVKHKPRFRVAKRGFLWEWSGSVLLGGPLGAFARTFPRSKFYYRDHGWALTKERAQFAALRSWERQVAWVERWQDGR